MDTLPEARPILILADVASRFESGVVEDWAKAQGVPASAIIGIPSSRNRRFNRTVSSLLDARIARNPDLTVVPVRVVWQVPERDGVRQVGIGDIIRAAGDPRDPRAPRQRYWARTQPERMKLVIGEPATAGEMMDAWHASRAASRLGDWVARRAWLALERAERHLRGNRYKIAKFVDEEITSQGSFQAGLADIAETENIPWERITKRAGHLLREIAAKPTTVGIDLMAGLIRVLYRQGYGRIEYDRHALTRTYAAAEDTPLIFLPSHKSQLDRLVMQYVLWENDLPPSHTAGGINLDFWPVGPLVRRTGVFFIRRSFKDDPTYKYVLRSYLDYLLSRRFPIEWYLEGGRSRTGKVRAPSFGLLSYVVDSYQRGVTDDVILVPTSITYDQIQDIGEYAAENKGAAKVDESFGWLLGAVRRMRRRYGDIHVRLGEPISLARDWRGTLERAEDERVSIDVARLAFEVMSRINAVTPVTPTAVVCLVLTDDPGPLPITEIATRTRTIAHEADRLDLPRTAHFDRPVDVSIVLDRLAEHGFVEETDAGWTVSQVQALAFYRNTMIHHLLVPAIVDLARAVGGDVEAIALRLRKLLKFDFFFDPKDAFVTSLEAAGETADRLPDLARLVLEPFLETYWATADVAASDTDPPTSKRVLDHIEDLLERGVLRRREAAMLPVVESALQLLAHVTGNGESTTSLAAELDGYLAVLAVDDRSPEGDHRPTDQHHGDTPEHGEFGEDVGEAAPLEEQRAEPA